jgi:single-stranded-DNA-specific exonuclease
MSGARYFLDVDSSLTGRAWRARLDAAGEARALAISQLTGRGDLLARILAGRGIDLDAVERHLEPTLRDLMPDPRKMVDMEAATARLAHALQHRQRVAIFGDYDVDGACSAALLSEYLQEVGCETLIHIPDRVSEGYGPNVEAMRQFQAQGADLVVTVDCGAVSFEPFQEAARLGLDVVVFDHHQAPEILPPALALVDPNRQDDLSGLGHLCAAGVVFMALVDLNRRQREAGAAAPDLMKKLDLVALATVADVVPLIGLNRAFVARGLEAMRKRERSGLAALFDVAGAGGPPTPYHLGFLVGPRINAGGRIGDAALGARLLTATDRQEATRIAAELDRLNRERQRIEAAVLAEAEAQAMFALGADERGAAVIVAGEGWPPGVVGLIAARLKERYGRPAFALALNGEDATGSARSIPGVDLGRLVRGLVDSGVAIKGGGHAMAAGVTIRRERLGEFRAGIEAALSAPVTEARRDAALAIDAALSAGAATPELMRGVEAAGPFGAGNAEPVFALPRHRITDVFVVGADHVRLKAVSGDGRALEAIAFRAAGKPLGQGLRSLEGGLAHLAGALAINRYGGRERVQLRLLDAAPAPM